MVQRGTFQAGWLSVMINLLQESTGEQAGNGPSLDLNEPNAGSDRYSLLADNIAEDKG